MTETKYDQLIEQSNYISRDLSWLEFNFRVLDQARKADRTILEKLKFMAITASNLDEFFMVRVGSLYNYLDYDKQRIDFSGLREWQFRLKLFAESQKFVEAQQSVFMRELLPQFDSNGFRLLSIEDTNKEMQMELADFFERTIYPMLTPMLYDEFHTFPLLLSNTLSFGVITRNLQDKTDTDKVSFVQIPPNLPRFYEFELDNQVAFLPLEEIIRWQLQELYKNVEIKAAGLFRVTRNGDFTIEESDDIDTDFIEELKSKVSGRRKERVVRIEAEPHCPQDILNILKQKWDLRDDNIFPQKTLMDFTGLWQIVKHKELVHLLPPTHRTVQPLSMKRNFDGDMFKLLQDHDIMLHHPYNSIEPLLQLIEEAADDPDVLSIKLTIYRLAEDSRVVNALLKAVEKGKHVIALFEVKARFDEENNLRQADRLRKAGCFVIYGLGSVKTHTKLLLIVRKEKDRVTRYVHMSSGNYNEDTAKLYTDTALMTTDEGYAQDVSEFFNVITGHSLPVDYQYLLTAPRDLRKQLIHLIQNEAVNAAAGKPSGIVIKVNSLQDKQSIDALYKASQQGVPIKLIVRGICCIRPDREGLSDNVFVKSIVGDYLEHSRVYYFHNEGEPKVFGGSADMMVRSFDRRIESLFMVNDPLLKQECMNILVYNLRDNVNSYIMQEDGSYIKQQPKEGEALFNAQLEFFKVSKKAVREAKLF